MRVLLLSDFYPPVVGGIERHVQSLGRELARRGHEVTVAAIGSSTGVETDGDVHVHRLRTTLARIPGAYADAAYPFAPPAPDPELVAGLAHVARESKPDVAHAHGWIAHSWIPVGAVAQVPLVVTLHDYGLTCAKRNLMYLGSPTCSGPGFEKCLRCASRHYGAARGVPVTLAGFISAPMERRAASRFIAVSRAVARGNQIEHLPHSVIPNFLPDEPDPDEAAHAARLAELPAEPFLLFVGALGAHKGLPVLLEAYRALDDPAPLVAIGHRWVDTPRSVPPGVVVLEDWPHEAVTLAWRRSLVGIVPSVWSEPFGIVALEAMQAGIPVIASRVGGLADVVQDRATGLLVEPGDTAGLSRAMELLLRDGELRGRLGATGRLAVKSYTAEHVVPQIEAVYRAVLR